MRLVRIGKLTGRGCAAFSLRRKVKDWQRSPFVCGSGRGCAA